MRALVIYFSQTGATLRIAEAIYSGIKGAGVECDITPVSTGLNWRNSVLRDIDINRVADYDLIAIGGIAAHFQVSENVPVMEEHLPDLTGKHCILFSTHAMNRGETFATIAEKMLAKGAIVIGYRSWYGSCYMNLTPKPYYPDGHPDDTDFREAADYGRQMVEHSRRISKGETGLLPQIPPVRGLTSPVEMKKMTHDKEKCAYPKCTLCMDFCPVGVINLSADPIIFQDDACINCHLCEKICPTAAINGDFEFMAKSYMENLFDLALDDAKKGMAKGYFRPLADFAEVKKANYWFKTTGRPRLRTEASPCVQECPVHMDIPGYMALVAEGKPREAYQLLRQTNPLPSVCGRVCYHPCESKCKRQFVDEPLAIDAIKRLITDQIDNGRLETHLITKNGKKVAVIGGGPCGLAAANDLALCGYEVTIFEALSELGGMMRVGIPEYRISRDIVGKDIKELLKAGIKVKLNTRIGTDITLSQLKKQGYESILLATGAHLAKPLNIEGINSDQVFQGIYLLKDRALGKLPENFFEDKRVVVIGGGNVAIDAARTALRLRAKEVYLSCLEAKEEMPAHPWEIAAAVKEGVITNCSFGPKRILKEGNKVTGVEFIGCTSVFDKDRRFNPCYDESIRTSIKADAVIVAIGQTPDTSYLKGEDGIIIARGGTIAVDKVNLKTGVEGIFAGSEAATGLGNVIQAIAAGKRAARSINNYLKGIPLDMYQTEYIGIVGSRSHQLSDQEIQLLKEKVETQKRVKMKEMPPKKRLKGFAEVELGLDMPEGQREASRCMKCGWAPWAPWDMDPKWYIDVKPFR